MNLDSLQGYSPISTKHLQQTQKDTSLSNSWRQMFHSSTRTSRNSIEESKINHLIARNRMARVLDSIYSKRLRYPYQEMKHCMLMSQLSLSEISNASNSRNSSMLKQGESESERWRRMRPGVETLVSVLKKIHQKAKVQSFTFMKMIAEECQEFNATRTEEPDTNWLRREQVNEGIDCLEKIVSQKLKLSWKIFFQNTKQQPRYRRRPSEILETPIKPPFFNQRRSSHRKQYSVQRTRDGKPVLTQTNPNIPPKSARKSSQIIEKVVQYVYIVKDSSESRPRSKSKYQSRDILMGRNYAPLSQRRIGGDYDYLNSESKHRFRNSGHRGSSKSKGNCGCVDQNRFYESIGVNSCKYCRLFMDQFQKPLTTNRKGKYSFFAK